MKQLPSDHKRSLENLVGLPLEDDQKVFILALTPGLEPTDQARQDAMAGLAQTWQKVGEHLHQQPTTEEEFDAAVDEAVNHLRRGQD